MGDLVGDLVGHRVGHLVGTQLGVLVGTAGTHTTWRLNRGALGGHATPRLSGHATRRLSGHATFEVFWFGLVKRLDLRVTTTSSAKSFGER